MKKLALAFSSKDRVDLSEQSSAILFNSPKNLHVYWNDGSSTPEGQLFHQNHRWHTQQRTRVTGGPDAAIVFALSQMLCEGIAPHDQYDYVGVLENDVLLDPDWLEPTLALFDYSRTEGLPVGAVSSRSFCDRILVQRDGYAIMHNVGAGHLILTREAAHIILQNYRTGWWPENRAVFSQLSGLDIGKWAAFHHNEQMITADWSFDTILAAHGLATVALTPSKATMIGQELSLEQQGLKLVTADVDSMRNDQAFEMYRRNLLAVQAGELDLGKVDFHLRNSSGIVTFPHHAARHGGKFTGNWKTRWMQPFGPFCYESQGDAYFSMPVFGPCGVHVGGGTVTLRDMATGYYTESDFAGTDQIVTLSVPRDKQYGEIAIAFGKGACLLGIETTQPQPQRNDTTFDYSTLPEPT
jgi:hypothetical protein